MQEKKQSLRKSMLSLRESLDPAVRKEQDSSILERLLQLPEYRNAKTVLGYMNFGSEFASELWVACAIKEGKRVALPRVNRHTDRLDLFIVEDLENQLEEGCWKIREPMVERCERLNAINEVEFALLPGIAFGRNGARLGYGGGFYDKLLAGCSARPLLAAAAYSLQVMDALPQEKTDVGINLIVTETGIIRC
jgi:5-formyltetrahydrofolate cyclo-ligase